MLTPLSGFESPLLTKGTSRSMFVPVSRPLTACAQNKVNPSQQNILGTPNSPSVSQVYFPNTINQEFDLNNHHLSISRASSIPRSTNLVHQNRLLFPHAQANVASQTSPTRVLSASATATPAVLNRATILQNQSKIRRLQHKSVDLTRKSSLSSSLTPHSQLHETSKLPKKSPPHFPVTQSSQNGVRGKQANKQLKNSRSTTPLNNNSYSRIQDFKSVLNDRFKTFHKSLSMSNSITVNNNNNINIESFTGAATQIPPKLLLKQGKTHKRQSISSQIEVNPADLIVQFPKASAIYKVRRQSKSIQLHLEKHSSTFSKKLQKQTEIQQSKELSESAMMNCSQSPQSTSAGSPILGMFDLQSIPIHGATAATDSIVGDFQLPSQVNQSIQSNSLNPPLQPAQTTSLLLSTQLHPEKQQESTMQMQMIESIQLYQQPEPLEISRQAESPIGTDRSMTSIMQTSHKRDEEMKISQIYSTFKDNSATTTHNQNYNYDAMKMSRSKNSSSGVSRFNSMEMSRSKALSSLEQPNHEQPNNDVSNLVSELQRRRQQSGEFAQMNSIRMDQSISIAKGPSLFVQGKISEPNSPFARSRCSIQIDSNQPESPVGGKSNVSSKKSISPANNSFSKLAYKTSIIKNSKWKSNAVTAVKNRENNKRMKILEDMQDVVRRAQKLNAHEALRKRLENNTKLLKAEELQRFSEMRHMFLSPFLRDLRELRISYGRAEEQFNDDWGFILFPTDRNIYENPPSLPDLNEPYYKIGQTYIGTPEQGFFSCLEEGTESIHDRCLQIEQKFKSHIKRCLQADSSRAEELKCRFAESVQLCDDKLSLEEISVLLQEIGSRHMNRKPVNESIPKKQQSRFSAISSGFKKNSINNGIKVAEQTLPEEATKTGDKDGNSGQQKKNPVGVTGTFSRIWQIIKKLQFFRKYSAEVCESIVNISNLCSYKKGDIIFHQGQLGNEMFVILKGSVHVRLNSTSAVLDEKALKPVIVTLYDGMQFGEAALLTNKAKKEQDDSKKIMNLKEMREKLASIERQREKERLEKEYHVNVNHAKLKNVVNILANPTRASLKTSLMQITSKENRRNATIEAAEDLELLSISKENFTNILLDMIQSELHSKIDLLKRIPAFLEVEYAHLISLANFIEIRTFYHGETILKEGEAGNHFCIINQGRCDVVKQELVSRDRAALVTRRAQLHSTAERAFFFNAAAEQNHIHAFPPNEEKRQGEASNTRLSTKNDYDDFPEVTSPNYIKVVHPEQLDAIAVQDEADLKAFKLKQLEPRHYKEVQSDEQNLVYWYMHEFGSLEVGDTFMTRTFLQEQSRHDHSLLPSLSFDPFEPSRLTIISASQKTEVAFINKNCFNLLASDLRMIITQGLKVDKDFDHKFTPESAAWIQRWDTMKQQIYLEEFKKMYITRMVSQGITNFTLPKSTEQSQSNPKVATTNSKNNSIKFKPSQIRNPAQFQTKQTK